MEPNQNFGYSVTLHLPSCSLKFDVVLHDLKGLCFCSSSYSCVLVIKREADPGRSKPLCHVLSVGSNLETSSFHECLSHVGVVRWRVPAACPEREGSASAVRSGILELCRVS